MKTVNKTILGNAMVVGLAMADWLPNTANAAEQMKPMKGGEHLLMLQGINTKEEADALKNEDSIAMVCAKCKTVWITRVKQGTKGARLLMEGAQPKELIGTHACAGCKSTIEVVGVQKGAHTELKHTCKV